MSLTTQDLSDIRDVVLDALDVAVLPRLDNLEESMDRLTGRMDTQESKVNDLESAQYETSRRLSSVETKLDDVGGKVTALHNDVVELYGMVS